jgi:hypothetical protein
VLKATKRKGQTARNVLAQRCRDFVGAGADDEVNRLLYSEACLSLTHKLPSLRLSLAFRALTLNVAKPFGELVNTGQVFDTGGVRDVMNLTPSVSNHDSRSGYAWDAVSGNEACCVVPS